MTPTIHNAAECGEIAKCVLMPGDPLRANYIAEKYLADIRLVSNTRNIPVYTGWYHGHEISVMASGMGCGSMGIYSYELYSEYGVESIIRVGSAGALNPGLNLGDVVLGIGACTDSNFTGHLDLPGQFVPVADFKLLSNAAQCAGTIGKHAIVGSLFSGVAFHYSSSFFEKWRDIGVLAVEMEAAALYANAALLGKRALAICTISDLVFGKGQYSIEERETAFNDMIQIALMTADKEYADE